MLRSQSTRARARTPSPKLALLTAAAIIAAGLSLWFAQLGPEAGGGVNALTLLGIGTLLVKGPRRRDPLRITRWLLLGALAAALLSSLMLVGYGFAAGHPPPRPWVGDAVDLMYVPLALLGLILIPGGQRGAEPRGRAAADGLLAASSTWYFVAGAATQHIGLHFGVSGIDRAVALAYAAGDIGILATALAVLSRCQPQLSRFVASIAGGLTLIAVGDLIDLVTRTSPYALAPVLLLQAGLLLLLFAAVVPSRRVMDGVAARTRLARLFEVAPFVPLGASIVMTTRMVLDGRGMPQSQVLPALLVAVALVARQYANSREKQGLLDRLRRREVSLEGALREDSLTGMGNRLALMERLASALVEERQWPVMVAVLDLDDFKLINDSYGHSVGDEVLRQAAQRVASAVRAEDLVVRLGGDEFAIVATRLEAGYREAVAGRLLRAFEVPLEVQRGHFRISPSVGIVIGQPPQSAEELLAHADAAMYKAKEEGRGGHGKVTLLDDDERRQVIHQIRVRHEIAEPDLGQFHVVYQPVVELASRRILGFEALLRWQHPELGPVPPGVFIPMAEQAGSIGVLGRFVMEQALRDLARIQWRHRHRHLFVGVNVSPRQLDEPGFTESTLRLLEANGLSADQLMLEITEHAVARNLDTVQAAAGDLSAAGIAIAVDDFGTGYSALHYLERLAPSTIKLDRSFLANQSRNGGSHRLLGSLITMTSGLGLRLVAEGIETTDELLMLRQAGCEIGQGYLFSRPVPLEQFERLLEAPALHGPQAETQV